jgi:hypothetical protein
MITLERDTLVFRFPEVHEHANTEIEFQRTLRIPDDTKEYPLPPGLGRFELRHIEDYKQKLPGAWIERGGVLMALHRAEAMWVSFKGGYRDHGYPCAIKIAAGKINAVSGKRWRPELTRAEHDYVVVPGQPWLDGFCVAKNQIRQFTAMPLGAGYTAEEQITARAEHGGLQIIVYPMKAERYELLERERRERERVRARRAAMAHLDAGIMCALASVPAPKAMGLAAGGRMRQEIYADRYGFDAWDTSASSKCFVTMVDAGQWAEITGEKPARTPPTAAEYSKAGLPWFDYYDESAETLAGAPALSMLKSLAEIAEEKGHDPLDDPAEAGKVDTSNLVKLGPTAAAAPSEARPVKGPGS